MVAVLFAQLPVKPTDTIGEIQAVRALAAWWQSRRHGLIHVCSHPDSLLNQPWGCLPTSNPSCYGVVCLAWLRSRGVMLASPASTLVAPTTWAPSVRMRWNIAISCSCQHAPMLSRTLPSSQRTAEHIRDPPALLSCSQWCTFIGRYRLFTRLRDRGLLHTMPTLLPGRLSSGLKAVVGLLGDRFYEYALPPPRCGDDVFLT